MRPSFEMYMARLDEWPFEVFVDLSYVGKAPVKGLPYRWHIRLELNHPTEDGLCSQEEEALLLAIQEEVLASMTPDRAALVAIVTHRKARTLVAYADVRPDQPHPIRDALERVNTHNTRIMYEEDPNWSEYREALYPSPEFQHQIKDRRILREFERCGDDCSEVRSIEPRFVGLTKEGAKTLSDALTQAGFAVKGVDEIGQNGKREWQVTGAAESPLALSVLDDFRRIWMQLAEEAHGRYDGWSAEIVPVNGANNNHGVDGHLSGNAEDYHSVGEQNRGRA